MFATGRTRPYISDNAVPSDPMKGRISNRLELILKDEGARSQLRKQLILGQDGEIRVNGRVFRLRLENATATRKGAHPRMIA